MSEREAHRPEPRDDRLPWLVRPWLQPFWYAYLAFSWWGAGVAETAGAKLSAPAAALVPAGKLAGALSEAAFYALWWRGRGRRLPYWRFLCVVVSASLADVVAIGLAQRARDGSPATSAWLAWVAGLRLLGAGAFGSPSLRVAFGGFGLLTLLRLGMTASAQSRATGVRAAEAFATTAIVWLLCRIAAWWVTDLLRGRSPLPIG